MLGATGAMLSRAAGQQLPLPELNMEQDADAYLVMVVDDIAVRGPGEVAQVQAAWVSPTGSVAKMPTGTGALSVAAYFAETGQLPSGKTLEVTSPTRHALRCLIGATVASVEGSVRIISLVELVADPSS